MTEILANLLLEILAEISTIKKYWNVISCDLLHNDLTDEEGHHGFVQKREE